MHLLSTFWHFFCAANTLRYVVHSSLIHYHLANDISSLSSYFFTIQFITNRLFSKLLFPLNRLRLLLHVLERLLYAPLLPPMWWVTCRMLHSYLGAKHVLRCRLCSTIQFSIVQHSHCYSIDQFCSALSLLSTWFMRYSSSWLHVFLCLL